MKQVAKIPSRPGWAVAQPSRSTLNSACLGVTYNAPLVNTLASRLESWRETSVAERVNPWWTLIREADLLNNTISYTLALWVPTVEKGQEGYLGL
jgi:hypothetical protein